jgi:pseudouridine synthase
VTEQQAERLQKVLARAGVASRRAAEELIVAGRVTVNGRVISELGTRVAATDTVAVDGERLPAHPDPLVYVMLNKPRGILSDVEDDRSRRTVVDLVGLQQRLFTVGRLDLDSEGLVLLTNDGELTHRLTHPRYGHEKEYQVLVAGIPSDQTLLKWRRGSVLLDGEPTAPCRVERVHVERHPAKGQDHTWLRVIMREGRKRQIRRVALALGHPVLRLIRTRIGPLELGRLGAGEWRQLTPAEVGALRKVVESRAQAKRVMHRGARSSASSTGRTTARRATGAAARLAPGVRPKKTPAHKR